MSSSILKAPFEGLPDVLEGPNGGPEGVGLVTFYRTYARERLGEDRLETFEECISRCLDACNSQLTVGFDASETSEFKKLLMGLRCSFGGRFLWQLGTDTVTRFGLTSLQNCAAAEVRNPVVFYAWLFDLLMLGAGVGYTITKEVVSKIPDVVVHPLRLTRIHAADPGACIAAWSEDDENPKDTHFYLDAGRQAVLFVADKRDGWVQLLRTVIASHFPVSAKAAGLGSLSCHELCYNTVGVRPHGVKIKKFGGVASGPETLTWGLAEVNRICNEAAGKPVTALLLLDIANIIGHIVVSGNVRRSAQIALGSADDVDYIHAKRWDLGGCPFYRSYSNNSVPVSGVDELPDEFWEGYAGNGEPYGLVNLNLCKQYGRIKTVPFLDHEVVVSDRKPDPGVVGVNPCVSGDTWTLTDEGPRQVIDLVDHPVKLVVDGKTYQTNGFFKTGLKELFCVKTVGGPSFKATADHLVLLSNGNWSRVCDLTPGKSEVKCQDHRSSEAASLPVRIFPDVEFNWKSDIDMAELERRPMSEQAYFVRNILYQNARYDHQNSTARVCGFDCAEGDPDEDEGMIVCDPAVVISYIQRTLLRLGIFCRKITETMLEIEGNTWKMLASGRCEFPYLASSGSYVVDSVDACGFEDVYDVTVPEVHRFDANGITVHNCSEQPLNDFETCCLSELFLSNCRTYDEAAKSVYYLYRTCKHSLRLPCHWKETEAVVHRNMRMGIGVTGYLEASEEQRSWLPALSDYVTLLDEAYSRTKGWPTSIRLTTVKPSGTLSLLGGVTSGGHPAFSKYYLKRMRISASDKLVDECRERGYHVEPVERKGKDGAVEYDQSTMVVDFPITHRDGVVTSEGMSAIDQIEVVRRLQRDWSDNAVSVTVYYSKEELPSIREYLRKHFRVGIKAISFLLRSDHGFAQAPWTKLTKEEYEQRLAKITRPFGAPGDVVFSMREEVDDDDLSQNQECDGGSCPRR